MTTRNRLGPCGLALCLLTGVFSPVPGRAQDTGERKIVKKVEAQYPAVLKRRGIGGTVRLKVLVHADGSVKDVEILGGNPALADAAEKAVRQWKFAPGSEGAITVAVNFDPNS
jgi:TonB family protein